MAFAAFAARAARQPARRALACGVTAGALADAALNFSAWLQDVLPAEPPVRPAGTALVPLPHIVAVALPRSADYVAALLGVLAAGCAWLAVDPRWPCARLAAVLADAKPGAVLVADAEDAAALAAALGDAPCAVLRVDTLPLFSAAPPPVATPRAEAAIAYVCYTSGSSGAPRGVLGTASGLLARCRSSAAVAPAADDDVAALRTPPPFVDAAAELFTPLLAGICVAIVPREADADPLALAAALDAARVTRLTLLPSLLAAALPALAPRAAPRLRLLLLSGEPLPRALAAAAAAACPAARLLNVYGCAEVGADATSYDVTADGLGPPDAWHVPVGTPLPGVWTALLDAQGDPVREAGQVGELLVGGVGVAAGYLNAPELTAQRFPLVQHQAQGAPERTHRTGDLAAWTPRGALVLRGRADAQLKLRGVRVDPTEVEAALLAHPAVAAAAVRAWPPAAADGGDEHARAWGEMRLAAYVVPRKGLPEASQEGLPAGLLTWLEARLPAAAVPAVVLSLAALPLTASGKVDRLALPQPAWPAELAAGAAEAADAQPSADVALEARLRAAFAVALGCSAEAVPPDADFFAALGGTSLSAAALCARLALPLQALLDHPSVRALARSGRVPPQAPQLPPQPCSESPQPPPAKRLRLPPPDAVPEPEPLLREDVDTWQPALAVSFAGRCDTVGDSIAAAKDAPSDAQPGDAQAPLPPLQLACAWRVPLHACVDASPLLLLPFKGSSAAAALPRRWRAVIGSHAHAVLCVEFDPPPPDASAAAASPAAARILWSTDVGARVEAAAVALRDGRHVAVGAHDGTLSLLRLTDGTCAARFTARGALNAAPAVDPWRGAVWAASHGRDALAISPPCTDRPARVTWRAELDGAVSAPPAFDARRRRVYFATLAGTLLAVDDAKPDLNAGDADASSPREAWRAPVGAAVFGAPAVGPDGAVLLACADGMLRCLAAVDGARLWVLRCGDGGPLFCAPALLGLRHTRVLVGTHDGWLLCVRSAGGGVAWRLRLPARVAAAAAPDTLAPAWAHAGGAVGAALVCVATVAGDVCVIAAPADEDDDSGGADTPTPRIVASVRLPGEAFSAPVMRQGMVLLGCRDDWLYALQIAPAA